MRNTTRRPAKKFDLTASLGDIDVELYNTWGMSDKMIKTAYQHLRTVVLQSGRVARWKGQIVSFAPGLGTVVGVFYPALIATQAQGCTFSNGTMNCNGSIYDFTSQIVISSNTDNLIENGSVISRTAGAGAGMRFDQRQNVSFAMSESRYVYNAGGDDAINGNDTTGARLSLFRSEINVNVVRNGIEINNSNDAHIYIESSRINVMSDPNPSGDALAFWASSNSRGFQNVLEISDGSELNGNRFGALISIREGSVFIEGESSVVGRFGGIALNVAGVDRIDVLDRSTVSGGSTFGIGAIGVDQSGRPLIINVNNSTIRGGNDISFGLSGGSISLRGSLSQNAQILVSNGSLLDGRVNLTVNADTMTVESSSILGDIDLGAGDDELNILASDVAGGVFGGAGSDDVRIFSGTNLVGILGFDGDLGAGSFSDGEIDKLNFDGWVGSIDGAQILNWEEVFVNDNGDVTFDGSMTPGAGLENENAADGLLFQVDEGSFARFARDFIIDGSVNNYGTLDLSTANGTPDTTLTIAGDYAAASDLILDVQLGDDSSPSDVLVIGGDTSGTTSVVINNTGGTGALTMSDGIRVVDADPNNTLDGEFVLAGPVIAGAYEYDLLLGPLMVPSDGDWYLRSAGFQPGAPVYETLPSVLLGLNHVGTLAQRIEGRQMLVGAVDLENPYGAWLRIEGGRTDVTPEASSTGVSYDQDTWRVQGGLDMMVYEGATGSLVGGINLFTGGSSVDVAAAAGGGGISTDANGVGLTATWYGNQGFYTDVQLQYTSLDSDLSSDVLGTLTSGLDGSGRLASIEMGQEFALPSGMTLTPQAQLTWSEVSFDSFTGPNGEAVSLGDNDSLQLRLGLAAEQSWNLNDGSQARLYGIANVTHEMRDTTSVMVSGTELSMSAPGWVGEIGLGGSYDWARADGGTSSLYGEVSASRELSGGEVRGLAGTVGFRMEF